MLLLRLASSKQAPDAPTLISSPPGDTKPKARPALSQPAKAGLQQHQQPAPSTELASAGCGNAAAARLLDLGKKLIEATREGRLEQVRLLVEGSGAPFTSDWLGTTALHVAAQCGHAEIAEVLVRGGVNRDARTKLERTALHLAAQSGCLQIVDLLIERGSDVNARDMLKMTPLHWAVERGHVVVAERLLIAGADLRAVNKFLLTPLDIARESHSHEMIELFKNWTGDKDGQGSAPYAKGASAMLGGDVGGLGAEDMLDLDYRLAFVDSAAGSRGCSSMLDHHEDSCIDLVGLEWNKYDFDPSLLLPSEASDDEPKVEYLMKVVEELQKENQQLRQKVDQLSTVEP